MWQALNAGDESCQMSGRLRPRQRPDETKRRFRANDHLGDPPERVPTLSASCRKLPDEALKPFGLEREIVTIVVGFSTALALARASDLIASVPERHTGNLRTGMHSFLLPVSTPEVTVSLLWHPRLDADPARRQ